eukprot:COSAG01_NODE_928_length_12680_cov_73.441380_9_plen_198_part_00
MVSAARATQLAHQSAGTCSSSASKAARRTARPTAVPSDLLQQLWPSEPYAIRGHFMRYVGNVRNVVLCNVTTEKRWGGAAAPPWMQAIKLQLSTLITPPPTPPPQKSQYRGGGHPHRPWQPYVSAVTRCGPLMLPRRSSHATTASLTVRSVHLRTIRPPSHAASLPDTLPPGEECQTNRKIFEMVEEDYCKVGSMRK